MASSRVDFGSCVLNRPSKFITNNGYLHSCSTNSGNTCADFESEKLKTQNNFDLSWLPCYDDDNSATESHQHICEIDFDYSWLPDHFDTKRNGSTAAAKSSSSNRETETENDSWLPSTLIVNGGNDESWLPNYNDVKRNNSTIPSKNGSNYSTFSSTHTVPIGNQSKEPKNNIKHKKSKNHDNWKRAHELVFSGDQQIQHGKPLNKKPESSKSQGRVSPFKSDRCSVETDSLGGVSTLRRRFQDLVESRNTRRKGKSFSSSNCCKSPVVLTESKNNNPPGSPSDFFDASDEIAPPSTTADCFVDVEKDRIRVVEIINRLSREEELAASQAAGNTNELFARICNTWDQKQVTGGKTRLIRGREAFIDFLNVMEQDKQRELEILAQRKPVSQFPYRARIRALLRVRFIKLCANKNQDLNRSAKGIKHHHRITELKTPVNEVTDKTHEIDSSSNSIQVPSRGDYDEKGLDNDIQLENFHDCISEYSQSQSDWEEEDENWEMQRCDDWISEISRPRSYWECLREARYKEMLHLYSHEQDLKELLERRMVTGFLSSDLRDKIDQLMVSQSQAQGVEVRKEGMEEEEDEDAESIIEREYRKCNEFIDQRSSSIVSCC